MPAVFLQLAALWLPGVAVARTESYVSSSPPGRAPKSTACPSLAPQDGRRIGSAEPRSGLRNRFEDRLQIEGRAADDDLQHIALTDVASDREYTFTEATAIGKVHTHLGVPLLRDKLPIGVNCAFGTSGGSWSLAIVRVLRPIELKYSLAARRTLSSPSVAFVAIRPHVDQRSLPGPCGQRRKWGMGRRRGRPKRAAVVGGFLPFPIFAG
jgi:hypothetical protein